MVNFFIDRPVFSAVISIVISLVGAICILTLPIAQYPQIVPPTVQVSATYDGANAQVVEESVATPIEQEVNGAQDMLYMNSVSSNDGRMVLNVTFDISRDLDLATWTCKTGWPWPIRACPRKSCGAASPLKSSPRTCCWSST